LAFAFREGQLPRNTGLDLRFHSCPCRLPKSHRNSQILVECVRQQTQPGHKFRRFAAARPPLARPAVATSWLLERPVPKCHATRLAHCWGRGAARRTGWYGDGWPRCQRSPSRAARERTAEGGAESSHRRCPAARWRTPCCRSSHRYRHSAAEAMPDNPRRPPGQP
jgi:hypothetical protein